jgi:hypothetical protein
MRQNFALEIESLISRLQPIRLEVLQAEQYFQKELDHVYSGNLQSARNLVHYLSLRRHAEVQEEILWICEAAHVPVIWATQVLESLVKRGLPSRA